MTVDRMRTIDRFAGIPLCWVMAVVVAFSRRRPPEPVRRILVVKFFGMGSILLSTAALRIVRDAFPDARIEFVSFAANRGLLERLEVIDVVHTVDPRSFVRLARDLIGVALTIRRARFDLVFDFEFFSKLSTLLAAWSGAPRRVGFALPVRWRAMLVTHHAPLTKSHHVVEAFAEQAFAIVPRCSVPPIAGVRITPDDEAMVEHLVPGATARTVVVNCNAGPSFLERRWQGASFSEMVDRLAADPGLRFVFIGLPSERGVVQRVIDGTRVASRCVNAAGDLTFPQLAAALRRCALFISNDSGPVHLAGAMGARVVALYGPETPEFYGPRGGRATVIYRGVECSPCMNIYNAKAFRCPFDARCMREITVDEVVNVATALLSNP